MSDSTDDPNNINRILGIEETKGVDNPKLIDVPQMNYPYHSERLLRPAEKKIIRTDFPDGSFQVELVDQPTTYVDELSVYKDCYNAQLQRANELKEEVITLRACVDYGAGLSRSESARADEAEETLAQAVAEIERLTKDNGELKLANGLGDVSIALGNKVIDNLERELKKWREWKPDDEDLQFMQEQAKARDGSYQSSLAVQAIYIGGLENKIQRQQEEIERMRKLTQDKTKIEFLGAQHRDIMLEVDRLYHLQQTSEARINRISDYIVMLLNGETK